MKDIRVDELLAAHTAAAQVLSGQLRRISVPDLELEVPPCPGWDLHTLVNHVVGGAERYAMLMEGARAVDVETTRNHEYVDGEPVLLQVQLDRRLHSAFARCSPTTRLPHRAGPVDRVALFRMRLLECLVHAWDIAITLGSPLCLDEELCRFVLEECGEPLVRLTQHGFYTPGSTDGADRPSGQLLAAAGRNSEPRAS